MNSANTDRAWAIFTARAILGIVFFVAGFYKVFLWGPLEHARVLFVEPYSTTFLPVWALWATGATVPVIELIAGAFVLIGLRTRAALVVLGGILVFVTFGHLLVQPSTALNAFILPRSGLLLFVLLLPHEADWFSCDRLLSRQVK